MRTSRVKMHARNNLTLTGHAKSLVVEANSSGTQTAFNIAAKTLNVRTLLCKNYCEKWTLKNDRKL